MPNNCTSLPPSECAPTCNLARFDSNLTAIGWEIIKSTRSRL
jgi:hypothetical protein